jgi:preprotein translocase subunit SecF
LGKVLNFEINAMFVTGVLAVVGYSVNDTIVVFDRIRENAIRNATENLENLINTSLTETVTRSLNTSLTTIFVILTLLFIGGPTIRGFLVVLLSGFIVGTYSSIFIAPQLLIVWDRHEWLKVFRSRKSDSSTATSGQTES